MFQRGNMQSPITVVCETMLTSTNMKLATIFVAFVALATGAPSDIDGRVSAGTIMDSPVPYLVSITLDNEHFCGGFIYSQHFVVTAASCVNGIEPNRLNVTLAQLSLTQLDSGELTIPVFKVHAHEAYDPINKLNDIAMLEFENAIAFGDNIAFIRYDEADEGYPTTSTAATEFFGWGTIVDGGVPSIKLRKITLTMISPYINRNCKVYTDTEYDAVYMLCAGDSSATDTGSPCHYDEGSPLVQTKLDGTTKIAVGIMSKNQGCNYPFEPTVFTRLTSYYSWLNKIGGLQPV